jgi:hypothetical protein
MSVLGRAIAQAVSSFLPRRPEFRPTSGHVGFVVDKVALEQVFSEYCGFPCQFSFYQLLHIHHQLSSGTDKIGQLVPNVPGGFSLTPHQVGKKQKSKKVEKQLRPQTLHVIKMSTLWRVRYSPDSV